MLDKNFMWSYILWNHPYVQSYECKWTELPCGTVCNDVEGIPTFAQEFDNIPRPLCCTHGNHVRHWNLSPSCHYSNLLQDLFYYTTPRKANSATTRTRGVSWTKQRDEARIMKTAAGVLYVYFAFLGLIFPSLYPFGCPCNYRPQYCNNQFFTLQTCAYVLQSITNPAIFRLNDETNSTRYTRHTTKSIHLS